MYVILGLSFVNTVMEGTANMMDKHQNFICHVTPIQNVKMVIGLCTYFTHKCVLTNVQL